VALAEQRSRVAQQPAGVPFGVVEDPEAEPLERGDSRRRWGPLGIDPAARIEHDVVISRHFSDPQCGEAGGCL
jgi:hypothetical protein